MASNKGWMSASVPRIVSYAIHPEANGAAEVLGFSETSMMALHGQ